MFRNAQPPSSERRSLAAHPGGGPQGWGWLGTPQARVRVFRNDQEPQGGDGRVGRSFCCTPQEAGPAPGGGEEGGRGPWASPYPLGLRSHAGNRSTVGRGRTVLPRCMVARESASSSCVWDCRQGGPDSGCPGTGLPPPSTGIAQWKVAHLLRPRGAGWMKRFQAHLGSGEATMGSWPWTISLFSRTKDTNMAQSLGMESHCSYICSFICSFAHSFIQQRHNECAPYTGACANARTSGRGMGITEPKPPTPRNPPC